MTTTQTKSRPIIFTGDSVRKILDGTKTQTRRIVKRDKAPQCDSLMKKPDNFGAGSEFFINMSNPTGPFLLCNCPYGKPGDTLWVRETWRELVDDELGHNRTAYKANPETLRFYSEKHSDKKWRSPIHMPRWASRLTLEITDVRAQRVQQISEEDAKAEGCEVDDEPCDHHRHSCSSVGCLGKTRKSTFCGLWNSINGAGSWESNPWVWAITFKKIGGAK